MPSYAERFASNLRDLRKSRNLTQKALAEALKFSEKTVSKWECGASIPDIETLFQVAGYLCVSIERLFRESKAYLLGINGGSTRTVLTLTDAEGIPIRTLQTGPCNPTDIGFETVCTTLRSAIGEISRDIPRSSIYLFAGIAGGTSADAQEKLAEFFSDFGFAAFRNDTDHKNIIAAGLGREDGIAVILGIGMCAYTQKNGQHKRFSGWGHLMDNGGSTYSLGRDALNAHFSALDGTGEQTLLSEEVMKIHPGTAAELMEHIYGGGRVAVASFAPALFAALERKDALAEKFLQQNMKQVAHFIETAAEEFDAEKIPVVMSGRLTLQPVVLTYLQKAMKDPGHFEIRILQKEPVSGAVMLAKRLMQEETLA